MVWRVLTALTLVTMVFSSALSTAAYIAADGRRCKRRNVVRYSRRSNQFRGIDSDEAYDNGWFKRELRCCKDTFNIIVQRIETKWNDYNTPLHARTVFSIRERVALTIYHLANCTTYSRSGLMFGISKSRAILYVDQVLKILIEFYESSTIICPEHLQNGRK
jgi:hypothetical protein